MSNQYTVEEALSTLTNVIIALTGQVDALQALVGKQSSTLIQTHAGLAFNQHLLAHLVGEEKVMELHEKFQASRREADTLRDVQQHIDSLGINFDDEEPEQ